MSENTADVVATKGANFTLTIDVATIAKEGAKLLVAGQPDRALEVADNGTEVSVTNVPAGDSTVSLALKWPPGDTRDATVDVKPGSISPASATVTVADPKPTIDNGDTPGFVELFGK